MGKNNYLYNYDFSQYSQLIAVYLFGSRAAGKEHPNADIDIALILDDDFDLLQNYNLPLVISSKLESITECKVDVVLFHRMDPLFQTEIRTKGKLIFVRDKEKLKKIFFKARKEFEDYLKLHKYYIRALKRRYMSHG
ncbi:MAG: nucleotidyltransferase domain-containing protein [Thermodesulfobacteriota bacterium]